jgi:hypothetical protein
MCEHVYWQDKHWACKVYLRGHTEITGGIRKFCL